MSNHTKKAVARFDKWADSYDDGRISPWFKFYQTLALSKLKLEHGGSFLDVGCGTGWAVRVAASRLKSGISCGIDISPKMIGNAVSRKSGGELENACFQIANSESIPFRDETFNSIICTFSIHHYENPVASLSEMKRVLKPDGTIVILESARELSPANWLQDRIRRYIEKSHVKYYTVNEMTNMLKKAELSLATKVDTFVKFMDHQKVFTGLMLLQCKK
jgi:ubiquinone/menaquinone biosynthesis C-methylase UbiE